MSNTQAPGRSRSIIFSVRSDLETPRFLRPRFGQKCKAFRLFRKDKLTLKAVFAAGLMLLGSSSAWSQTCASYPYTLANGTTADASQVMANFSAIQNCANTSLAPLASPSFSTSTKITNDGNSAYVQLLSYRNTVNHGSLLADSARGSAAAPLALANGDTVLEIDGLAYDGSSFVSDAARIILGLNGTPSAGITPGLIDFRTMDASGTEAPRMRITSAGNVGIGTLTPADLLYVNGTAGGTSAWSSPSDVRLKKNIVPIDNALALIEGLRGVRFDWRPPQERSVGKDLNLPVGRRQLGFIAQDLQKVLPEAVGVASGREALMSVQETKVVPVLVEAVKELAALNRSQAAQIAKLQDRVGSLERAQRRRTADVGKLNHF